MTDSRVDVLGVRVNAIDLAGAVAKIEASLEAGRGGYVCVTGVHGVMESHRDHSLRAIHNQALMVTPDGMPLVFLCRLAGRSSTDRVYGPDLLHAVCRHSEKTGWRHYFYGGGEGVPERLVASLQAQFPSLAVAGTCSPPFRELRPDEDDAIVARIVAARPDIVWVGLSTPKQERWMAAHEDRLRGMVLVGVGAAFDFGAGLKPQAPRWMQRAALEWLFRLVTEPRRLWRRYLINNPQFVVLIARQLLTQRASKSS